MFYIGLPKVPELFVCQLYSYTYCVPPCVVDESGYSAENYSMLSSPDYRKPVHMLSDCLSLCSINQSCAAMSYDAFTSTCYMSGMPTFLNITGVEPTARMKKAHASKLTLLNCASKGVLTVYHKSLNESCWWLRKLRNIIQRIKAST